MRSAAEGAVQAARPVIDRAGRRRVGRDAVVPGRWYRSRLMKAEASDAALLAAIALGGAGLREAERALCRRYAPRIRLYGLRHLRDDERSRDVVQTVLLGVLQAAREGRVREPEQLVRFVLGTCRNAVLRLRELDRRAEPSSDDVLVAAAGTEAPRDPVNAALLLRCLASLGDRARRVLELSFHEELESDEVAQRLALTRGNVRVIRHRALAALRACIDAPARERA
jgi:RNA polymerase sigma-70 factor (ECF subfamily)